MRLKHGVFIRILSALVLIFLPCINTLQAEEFHVTTAVEFQNALTTARDNGEADTIWLAAGTYNTSDNSYAFTYIAKEGEAYALTIKGEDSTTAEDVILYGNNEDEVLSIEQANAPVTIEGITVREGWGREGIMISSANDVTMSDNIIAKNGTGVSVFSSSNVALINNIIMENYKGVFITASQEIILTNNTITRNEGAGINISSEGDIT